MAHERARHHLRRFKAAHLAGFVPRKLGGVALVYEFSQVPNLDAVSIVLLVLAVALSLSSPLIWANWKDSKDAGKTRNRQVKSYSRARAKGVKKA